MIVILRDQLPEVNPDRGARRLRASAIASAQAPLLADLQASTARSIRSFETLNGFATSLSKGEIERLAAHPLVLAVVPDRVIARPPRPQRRARATTHGTAAGGRGDASLCNTLEPEALELTNTAFADPTIPQAQEVRDGNGERITGKGVKVAAIAGGVDTTIRAFTRPDGSNVFIDYQDFSGDPAGSPVGESEEMFGDTGTIAAQDMPNGQPLEFDIGPWTSSAYPVPSPCNIRVRGISPGASLVGLDVYSYYGYDSYASTWVQAIDWAVVHDEVDVLNESFTSNGSPDDSVDPISLANAAAVRAGVTVVAAAGDASSNDTIGSPATDSFVIGAGATTQFRLYQQIHYDMFPLANGYIDGNISSFSSGGFAESRPRTIDLVAPGDLGWGLCSTNQAIYWDCTDLTGAPTPLQLFGGTSEASPIAAGVAALVIQAYRSTHGGASPSPALVKSILMGSATDLGAPSDEQGAGLINALKAVNTALSVQDGAGRPPTRGDGLLATPGSATATVQAGGDVTRTFQITNTGPTALEVHPALEALGVPFAGGSADLSLDPASDATFIDGFGATDPYVENRFTVPSGADHLDAAIAWQGELAGQQTYVEFVLLDPSGKQAAYSFPQGDGGGYGHVDVVKPAAGAWTIAIRTTAAGTSTSYAGPVKFSWSTERFAPVGEVAPSTLTVPRGSTATVVARLDPRTQPGDFAAALRLHGRGDVALSEIPFTVRTLIPVDSRGGSFTGTLTGGNARAYIDPVATYAFDVPEGAHDLSLSLALPDIGYEVAGYLVDPNGMVLSSNSSVDPTGAPATALELYSARPQAGRWRFLLQQVQSSGNETSGAFHARISFNRAAASAPGLPTSAHTVLSASAPPITIPVTITNTGGVAKAFYVDPRLATSAQQPLSPQLCGTASTLPGYCGYAYVPPRSSAVTFTATSSIPIQLEAYLFSLDPFLSGRMLADGSAAASISAPEVAWGPWYLSPALIGPFGASGAPTVPVTMSGVATMQPFDTSITADSGDLWTDLVQGTATYNPLTVAAGTTGVITLTLTPDPTQVGKTIRGFLYVEATTAVDQYGIGDELAQIPYEYTVGK